MAVSKNALNIKNNNTSLESLPLAFAAVQAALNQKALDVAVLDLSEISDITDSFVIVSGTSQRHVKSIADKIREALKSIGEQTLAVDGEEKGDWVLLDYASLMVHVFYEPIRQFYDLEGLWKNAKKVSLPDDLEMDAKRLRTGMFRQ